MPEPRSLLVDEAQRAGDHEAIKSKLRHEVHEAIEHQSAGDTPAGRAQVAAVARDLKAKSVAEVQESEHELDRARTVARIRQVVDYLFYVVYGLVGLLIVLELLGARDESGFKRFMNAVTTPLVAPFKGLMPDPALGGIQLMVSYIIGLVVYFLLHLAVRGLLRLVATRSTSI